MKKKNERKTQRTQKQLPGQFIRQTTGKISEDWQGWLRKGCLKRKTGALIMAAQEQVIRANNKNIDKCVNHVLTKCSKLAQKECKRRLDWFKTKINWEIRRKNGKEVKKMQHEHKLEIVRENDECKILWDFTI